MSLGFACLGALTIRNFEEEVGAQTRWVLPQMVKSVLGQKVPVDMVAGEGVADAQNLGQTRASRTSSAPDHSRCKPRLC